MKIKIESIILKSNEMGLLDIKKLKQIREKYGNIQWIPEFLGWKQNVSRR